ncbi:MAG TPA: organic solvent tolerance protein OstA [Pirellulaceae bacterium]|nr:organic solvent tolerance protein OstA [Pirellulaceae bacterium]HMO92417.1 organic solvent tolerance protein OstA [Pirellulaceae bacterium]HMP69536.1 organic solvent tolerance protein OstA [Pirellulaceae bacterium]
MLTCLMIAACSVCASSARGQVWSERTLDPPLELIPTINLPPTSDQNAVHVWAGEIARWKHGAYEVLCCDQGVTIQQGERQLTSTRAVLWVDREPEPGSLQSKIIVYLDGNVRIQQIKAGFESMHIDHDRAQSGRPTEPKLVGSINDDSWFGRLVTASNLHVAGVTQELDAPIESNELWQRASQAWEQAHRQLEFESKYIWPAQALDENQTMMNQSILVSPQTGQVMIQPVVPQSQHPTLEHSSVPFDNASYQNTFSDQSTVPGAPARSREPLVSTRVRITPRQSLATSGIRARPSGVPGETIVTATGGVRVVIDSDEIREIEGFGQPRTSQIVIEADSVVAWTNQLGGNGPANEPPRWEIYLEGNVEFVMGQRVIFAERMFYDVNSRLGTILDIEMLTPVENYQGLARLKADVVQQNGENNLVAYGAAITSSRLGVPRYWLQSGQLDLTREEVLARNGMIGTAQFDPASGQLLTEEEYFVESNNNRVYVGGVPVLYWPTIRTSLSNPSYYVERIRLGNDRIYGNHAIIGLDLFQILGLREPRNTNWIGDIGYLENRGPVFGTEFEYQWGQFIGIPGDVHGSLKSWFVDDSGLDNLGRQRRNVPLEESFRGRALWRHQHLFSPGFRLQAEAGWLSDRNFLEQYFEREWDTDKDYDTGVRLIRNFDNQSLQLNANVRINDFLTQTNWLPRLDHHIIGQSVFGSNLVWHAHSHIGYGQFQAADAPNNPVDLLLYTPLEWEIADAAGVRLGTRQELDLPFQLGAVRVTPYVLGDITYWQEDLNGNDLTRTYAQTGIRATLPLWRVDPTVHSVLFNMNGLAHKASFDTEILVADANRGFLDLPLYDPLNDDAQEAFQRRFITSLFGGALPPQYDERFYAIRSALQSNVSSPSSEMANDLAVVKIGMKNRWQTKRGLPGEARIIDLVKFDIGGSYFPDASRDNFGANFGMLNYDFAWYIGDRLSLLSDGYYDLFGQGLRTTSLGMLGTRPGIGDVYVGVRSIEGPISSNILTTTLTYRMSDKWALRGASSVDFSSTGNIGQNINLIRIGESFLLRFGVNVNASRGNVGFIVGLEPRFLPSGRLGMIGRQRIPPASSMYLE